MTAWIRGLGHRFPELRRWRSLVQVSLAAGLAWWVALLVLFGDQPFYAPVAAVVVTGAGDQRRLGRMVWMMAGMLLAVGTAEVLVLVIGSGVWQMILVTALATVAARLIFEEALARSYAVLNAAVLVALGGSGWIPYRLVEAALGGLIALVIVHIVVPPKPVDEALALLDRVVGDAREVLDTVATALEEGRLELADEASIQSTQLEERLRSLPKDIAFADQVAQVSPLRRRDRHDVERLEQLAGRLRPVLRGVTTLTRLASRLLGLQSGPYPRLAEGVREAKAAMRVGYLATRDGAKSLSEEAVGWARAVQEVVSRGDVVEETIDGLSAEVDRLTADLVSLGQGGTSESHPPDDLSPRRPGSWL